MSQPDYGDLLADYCSLGYSSFDAAMYAGNGIDPDQDEWENEEDAERDCGDEETESLEPAD